MDLTQYLQTCYWNGSSCLNLNSCSDIKISGVSDTSALGECALAGCTINQNVECIEPNYSSCSEIEEELECKSSRLSMDCYWENSICS